MDISDSEKISLFNLPRTGLFMWAMQSRSDHVVLGTPFSS